MVCILAGGLSTRLRPLTNTIPKPMILVGGKPFLQAQMEHFASLGFSRFTLAVSYLWEQIRDYFGDGSAFGWEIAYSVEPQPLGTGGAVLWAQSFWGERALVANGDTYLPEDWRNLVAAHEQSRLPVTMAMVRQEDCSRFGSLEVRENVVIAMREKNPQPGPGWINAGVYVIDAEVLSGRRRGETFSLEKDIFPGLAGRMGAYRCEENFVDIGTHESLEEFQGRFNRTQPRQE